MEISGFWVVFAVACGGGIAAEALKWFGLRDSPNTPQYVHSVKYWVLTVIMILIGGGLAPLYGTKDVNALLAVNIGASAPLIIGALFRTVPATPIPPSGTPPSPTPPVLTRTVPDEPAVRAEATLPPKAKRAEPSLKSFLGGR
ncbi:MAG: hypothetical protein PHN78_06355 [Dehalococcoidales bacterium]|nr:hypothetical protein [Dehalococcoidales bacterium]